MVRAGARYNGTFVARTKRLFGVSTHLYHGHRLTRDHLLEIAAHGFETVELAATRTHIDYHNPAVIADLQQWLAEAGLALHSIHAPIALSFENGRAGPPLSIASPDADARAAAVAEAERALHIARRIPAQVLVAHLGLPRAEAGPGGNSREAARRSAEDLARLAAPLGVQLALEVIPNELSRAGSLVHFVEEELDDTGIGICLDFGHAHMDGDLIDALETVSGHLITAHVHDNRGRSDDHLIPFEGTIDWPSTLTVVQKVGYEGPFVFEIAARGSLGSTKDTLARAQKARRRIEQMLSIA
jgi:sugar phosphate isomerase/epimerase